MKDACACVWSMESGISGVMRRVSRCHWLRGEDKGWGREYISCTSSETWLKSYQPLDQRLVSQRGIIIETTSTEPEKQSVGCRYSNCHANRMF
jgi:hypothetical protein